MSINRVVLIGNLTRDPELRVLPSGKTVCHLRVACNHMRRSEEGGWQARPSFFDVSVFGPQAENVERYLRKGRPVGVDGRLDWREWETPDQHKRQAVSIVANTIQFLGRPDTPTEAAAGEPDPDVSIESEAPSESVEANPVDEALIF